MAAVYLESLCCAAIRPATPQLGTSAPDRSHSRPSLTMLARVKSFFLSFHSFFRLSLHTSPFTPASGLVRFL
jgi:hypothetical protein